MRSAWGLKSSSSLTRNRAALVAEAFQLCSRSIPDDYFWVTVGENVSEEMPRFAGETFTVTAYQQDPQNKGYLYGMLVENGAYVDAIKEVVKDTLPNKMKLSSCLLVYFFIHGNDIVDDQKSATRLQCDRMSAIIIDADWLQKFGQTLAMTYHKIQLPFAPKLWPSRHLKFKIKADMLISQGAAVTTSLVPIAGLDMDRVDQFKLVMNNKMQVIEDHTEMLRLCANLTDDVEANKEEPIEIVKQVIEEEKTKEKKLSEIAAEWEATNLISTPSSSSEGEAVKSMKAQLERLKKMELVEVSGVDLFNWRWKPTKTLGECSVVAIDPQNNSLTGLNAAAHLAESVSHYRASYKDFKFWSAVEVACSLIVNVIFGVIG